MAAEQEVLEREDALQRAIESRDRDAAAGILTNDYALVVTHPKPAVMPRAEWLKLLPDYRVSAYEVQHRSVEIRNDVAVVTQRVDMTALVAGGDRSGLFILVDVWVDDAGTWRIWRRNSTPLSAGPLPSS